MTNPVGRPQIPDSDRAKTRSINIDDETWDMAKKKAQKYGFIYESGKRAGEPNLSAFIRHLVRECE